MAIEYFDFEKNLTERSPKNMPRPFRPYEAFYVNGSETVQNPDFNIELARRNINQDIKAKRIARYKKETDSLLLEIQAMQLLGQDPNGKIDEFKNRYYKIKEELELK